MHRHNRHGFSISVGTTLSVLLRVVPIGSERIRKSDKAAGFVGARHFQDHLDVR